MLGGGGDNVIPARVAGINDSANVDSLTHVLRLNDNRQYGNGANVFPLPR